jgi:TolB-like protein/class 3 adenylate cyclase/tetratricopeptide (TPR) repeat protein
VADSRVEHRFAVILCADVVGYSRLMGIDEEGTLAALRTVRQDLVDPKIAEHRGRIVRTMGDGLLVEFSSVVDAVRCAIAIQRAMPELSADVPADRRLQFRFAINMGDVVSDGDLIYGDGVAIASRMEALAEPGGINVSRAVRDQVRDRLPIMFEDCGQHEVKNINRPVRVFRVVLEERPAGPASTGRRRPAVPVDRPALAVLPFQNLGGDAETEFFLDSVAEDLITELARARWFSIVARNTSFSYKGKGADSKQVGRELGVRYVVEGSLRKAGNRVRISCQLVEAASGQHLWADRFDGTLEDTFDLQDRITESVIGSVGPVLREAEIERARRKPEANQDAYDLTLRAFPPTFAETPEDNEEALRLLTEALEADPDFAMANALAAWCYQQRHLMDWPGTQPEDREAARRMARAAIDQGADAPLALALGGAVHASLTRDHDFALAAVDRAMMINTNAAAVLGFDALTRCICGSYDVAVEHAEKALRLSPLEPLVYHAALALALACLLSGRTEEAVAHARKAIEGNRNFVFPYCILALASARLGRPDEAAETVRHLVRVAPRFRLGSLRRIRLADEARFQSDLELLREAQIPE